MNEKEAIDLSIDIWKQLAKNGLLEKSDIKETAFLLEGCPLCHYVEEIVTDLGFWYIYGDIEYNSDACTECPGYGKWPTPDGPVNRCEDGLTPWFKWKYLSKGIPSKKINATEMVKFLKTLKEDCND